MKGETSFEDVFLLRFYATPFRKVLKGANEDLNPPTPSHHLKMYLTPDLESNRIRYAEVALAAIL